MDNKKNTMKQLPMSEQPYEKCEKYGVKYLSDAELLAIIIRTGSHGEKCVDLSRRVLEKLPQKSISGLFHVTAMQLCEIKGIGKVKAIQLLCLAEIAQRIFQSECRIEKLVCEEPDKVALYFMASMRFLETEQVKLLILNGRNAVTKEIEISNGSFNASMASPREIFYCALKHKAVAILLVHNHPSGDPSPSKEDFIITKRVEETGKMIGIPLIDHIIIGGNRYVSLKESGYLS